MPPRSSPTDTGRGEAGNRVWSPSSRGKLLCLYCVTAGLTALAILAGMEAMLRLFVDRTLKFERATALVASGIPGLGYRLAPNTSSGPVRTDARGLRLRTPGREPASRSVLLLGDSIGYGMGVPYEQSLAPQLERRLSDGLGRPVAVWNACVPGYNTAQESVLLEQVAPSVRPGLILVQFCMNDYLEAPVLNPAGYLDVAGPAPDGRVSLAGMASSSRALLFLKEKLRDFQQLRPEWFPRRLHYVHYLDRKPGWQRAKANLERIREAAERSQARLLVLVFPVEPQLRIGDNTAQQDLDRFGRARQIEFMDLYPVYRAHWREGLYVDLWRRSGVVDKMHPNVRGHALAAETVARRILAAPGRYLPASPPEAAGH